MGSEKVKAKEYYIKDFLSNKFLFEIPNYQRQYCWNKENINQLIDDIIDAIENNRDDYGDNFDLYEPYFIGSIILCTKNSRDDGSGLYDVIDGQQRLTSITMLVAVIRDLIENKEYKNVLSSLIYQKSNALMGIKESIRLSVRDKEQEFFKKYILENGGTSLIDEVDEETLNEAKESMIKAISIFKDKFHDEDGILDKELLNTFIMYLLQRVVLIAITTDSFASAFRLFNVINARGLPLTNSDLLKSENLRAIGEEKQDKYTKTWEDMEDEIGRETLEMLIGFMRTLKLRKKATSTIFEEYVKKVFVDEPNFRGENFIDTIEDIKNIYQKYIVDATIDVNDEAKTNYYNNLMNLMRDGISFNEWMCTVVKFVQKFRDDNALYEFIITLERKITVDWVNGLNFSERTSRLHRIISIIEESNSLEEVLNSDIFTKELNHSRALFYNSLNDSDFYTKGRMMIPKYVLMRMEMEKTSPCKKKLEFNLSKTSLEHILPRRPSNAYWKDAFTTNERKVWADRIGNLIFINGAKNPLHSGKAFDEKLKIYVLKKGEFQINKDIFKQQHWNAENVKKRQENLIDEALKIWMK